MTDIVIPVKRLSMAKQRLMGVLSPDERKDLVVAMLQDLLGVVSEADCGRILIVASDDIVFDVAQRFDATSVFEHEIEGYNAAVSKGLAKTRAGNVCILPGDLPLATADEIACLCAPADADRRCIRLAASHDKQGTNGVFQSSRDLILPDFGLNSFVRHQRAARAAGVAPTLLEAPGMSRDIDKPSDLIALADCPKSSATKAFFDKIWDRLSITEPRRGVA